MAIEMRECTRAEFYAIMGPLNVHPRPERDRMVWETPGRQLIGVSTPGYTVEGPETFRVVVTR